MTRKIRAASHDTVRNNDVAAVAAARRLASQILARWQHGEPADARAAFQGFPALRQYRSVAMNIVYEDYCQRLERGEQVDRDAFIAQFPELEIEIRRQIEVHDYLAKFGDISAPDDSPLWPSPGDRFLGFDIREELGRGAIARVYLATEWAIGDRFVAVKVSPGGAAEAQILGRLEHPNIVPILSVSEEEQSRLSAVCMPYRGRITFAELLDALFANGMRPTTASHLNDVFAKLSRDEVNGTFRSAAGHRGLYVDAVLSLVRQVSSALDYTHCREMLHHDLKPSNILLSTEGVPMLLDFNLSQDKQKTISRLGGTLPYMSPEQIRQTMFFATNVAKGRPNEAVDGRSDIFALGVIAYELLTGVQPFSDFAALPISEDYANDLLDRQAKGVLPAHKLNPQIDREVSALVESCMAFDVGSRPPSAAVLCERIDDLLRWKSRSRRWVRWHPIRTAAAAITLASVIAAGSVLYATAPTDWERGLQLFQEGRMADAAELFRTETEKHPDYPAPWFALGMAQVRAESSAFAAQQSFQRALDLTDDPRLKAAVAYCESKQGLTHSSANKYLEAINAGDNHPSNHYNRAAALRDASSLAYYFAIEECSNALILDADLFPARHLRGYLTFSRALNDPSGKIDSVASYLDARTDVQAAINAAPQYAQYHFDLARIAEGLFKLSEKNESEEHRLLVFHSLMRAVKLGMAKEDILNNWSVVDCLTEQEKRLFAASADQPSTFVAPPAYLLPPLLQGNLPESYDSDWQHSN